MPIEIRRTNINYELLDRNGDHKDFDLNTYDFLDINSNDGGLSSTNNDISENIDISISFPNSSLQLMPPLDNFQGNNLNMEKEEKIPLKSKKSLTEIKNAEKSQEINIIIDSKIDKEIKPYFKVIYPKINNLLFTQSETLFIEGFDLNNKNSKKRIRYPSRRNRGDNDDNIRRMIKRYFMNKALLNQINNLLRRRGSTLFFERFPQKFVADISIQRNSLIINMTLKQIFEKKEFYIGYNTELNYYHNLKVLNLISKEKNFELDKIINTMLCDLFDDYINSDEFKIDEIKRLKKKNKSNDFIERYIYLSNNFIEFYSN